MPFDFLLTSEGTLWTATFGGGVNVFEENSETFTYINTFNKEIPIISDLAYSMIERVPGEFWIGTEYGLSIYYSDSKELKTIVQSDCNSESIRENRLRDLFVDSKGIVWIGTESGVEKFVTQNNFKIYTGFFTNKTEIGSAIVKSIESDNEYFWVGFIDYGLIRYSYKTFTSKHYFFKSPNQGRAAVSNINAIMNDRNNTLWVADWNYGLMKYDRTNDDFLSISNAYFEQNRLSDNRIQRILEDKKGLLWLGTEGGLNRYDIARDTFIQYRNDPKDPNSISSNSIQSQAMTFDKDSNLWLGTWSFGLNKMEFSDSERIKASFKRWVNVPGDTNSLPNNNVISLLYDTTTLWIGTFGGGLSKMDLKTKKFTTYTTEDGLPNNIIFAIIKDKKGHLWLSTDYGISMFDPVNETFYNYTKEDGLQDNHFFWGAAFKNKNGTIFFGGIKGINSFVPEEVKPDTTPAQPVIVDIKLFNKSIDNQRYNYLSKEVVFHYYENFISFEFTALDYSEPKNNLYKYKLEGFDKDWNYSKNFNYASYTNLPSGDYTFKLQVANSDGIWNDEVLSLKIIVVPPWWQTIIARVLFILIIVAVVFFSVRIRINILKKQKRKLEKLVEDRTEEVRIKNDQLSEKYDEIVAQEEEIREQAEELRALSEKLKDSNINLAEKVKERTIELENALGKAEDSQKLISSFLSNFSHEIRTPLNAIMGFSQIVGGEELTEEKKGHYADIVEQNVQSLLLQIGYIMDVAKLHTGQYVLKNDLFSLNNLYHEVYNELKNNSKVIHGHISFELNFKEEINIRSDKEAFKGLLYNLVDNAIKYTEQGFVEFGYYVKPEREIEKPQFEIGNQHSEQMLILFVKDTGIGIPEESHKMIFDAFRKVENTNKKLYRGTGVGLALVKNMTDKLGGKVHMESKVNQGTLITLELPISEVS
jgi:signal transduction histidine kinase/ligand-binding sensor domain-containing protein